MMPLDHLAVALAAFLAGHFALSSRRVRDPLVARIGEQAFLGAYALVAVLTLGWAIWVYRQAPYVELWAAPIAVRHISLTVMVIVAMMVVASFSRQNPAIAGAPPPDLTRGPRGIFRITRHPFMWGVALWALAHIAANGDAASVMLFGALAVLAIGGTLHTDSRKRRLLGPAWDVYAAQSSHLPFLAIAQGRTRLAWSEIGWRPAILGFALYVVMLVLHEPVIGVAPVSLVAGLFG